MDIGRESAIPAVKDYQVDGSWAPATPVRSSSSTTPQPICTDIPKNQAARAIWLQSEKILQGNQLSKTNLLETEIFSPGFQPRSQDRTVVACCSTTDLNNSDAILPTKSKAHGDNAGIYNNLPIDDADRWHNVPFGHLLALADAATSTPTFAHANFPNQVNATSSSFISISNSHVVESQFATRFKNPSLTNQDPLLGSMFQFNSGCTSDIQHYGHSISSQPTFDLNSPLRTTEAVLSSISSKLAPITPDQAKSIEKRQLSNFQTLFVNEREDHSRGKQNEITTEMVGVNEIHQEKEQLELLTDQAGAGLTNQFLENHNPDKGGNQGTDTNKTPQQKIRRKRHRPKVIIEGQPKRTPKPRTPKPTPPKDPKTGKRKYVRRNGLNKTATTPTSEVTSETTDPRTARRTRKSCRRSLNFDFKNQAREESSSSRPSSNFDSELHEHNYLTRVRSRSTAELREGLEENAVMTQVPIAYDVTCSEIHALEGYISTPEIKTPDLSTPSKTIPENNKLMVDSQNGLTRGKCRITFSEETRDKEVSAALLMTNNNPQLTPRSPNDSNCSSSTCLTIAKRAKGIKRKHASTTDEAELCIANGIGGYYPSENASPAIFPFSEYNNRLLNFQFPAVSKKKRTEKGHTSTTCDMLSAMTTAENHARQTWTLNDASTSSFTSEINCSIPVAHVNAYDGPNKNEAMQDIRHTFKSMLVFDHKERLTKKRSKGATRVRDLASLTEICKQLPTSAREELYGVTQGYENPNQSSICMEALVAGASATMTRRKRTKRSFTINSVPSNYNHQQFLTKLIGPIKLAVDVVAEQFEHLNIKAESNQPLNEESNALIPYNMRRINSGSAVALYQINGILVPFDGSFDPVRKRRPRPKVDLDDETNKVWKLLLEDINNEGIDGTDEEKTKWWEEERRVFCGRADSFIARMHLVQGDRRFSQWKGSVVDSVVGVFLTQNVSDHLSSSAFMSLAAHFPLKSKSMNGQPQEERVSISLKEPEVCGLNVDDNIEWHEEKSNQPPFDHSFLKLQDMKSKEETEVINRNISLGSRNYDVKAPVNSSCKLLDSSKSSPEIYSQSAVNTPAITGVDATSSIGDQREMDDALSSQNSVVSSQNSVDLFQTAERICSWSQSNSEAELTAQSTPDSFGGSTSFVELLQRARSITLNGVNDQMNGNMSSTKNGHYQSEDMAFDSPKQNKNQLDNLRASSGLNVSSSNYHLNMTLDSGTLEVGCLEMFKEDSRFSNISFKQKEENCTSEQSGLSAESSSQARVQEMLTLSSQEAQKSPNGTNHSRNNYQVEVNKTSTSETTIEHSKNDIESQSQRNVHITRQVVETLVYSEQTLDVSASTSLLDNSREDKHMLVGTNLNDVDGMNTSTSKPKRGRIRKEKQSTIDWDSLRKQAQANGGTREKAANTMDSLDWEAVRQADVNEIANTIKERGMNNLLAERIKDFLNRLVREHGSIDLEWLRDVPPDKAKEYLLSIRGLGLKSVECVRLLTLHHLAFPVDTNVGRIAVRLGWVPLQPLPESLQLHLLELYPVLESIQKYLWPRLCKLDQRTLYELHYQMITFGKVFCTKSKPNCNACPMRGECRHFASAFASARLALPAPEEKSIVCGTENEVADQNPVGIIHPLQLHLLQINQQPELQSDRNCEPIVEVPATPEPIVEVPTTPEPEQTQILENDIEDTICEDPYEIPTIKLNMVEFTQNLQNYIQQNMELKEGDMSKALVALIPEAASIPMPKLKNVSQLRTEHQVYELPDSHPLLEGLDKREPDDPCPYLLAIWTPGETANSIQPPERRCTFQDSGKLCDEKTCFSCNSIREANSQTVRGTLLIPCRTAMRGSFPLNGTYFQVNEVFADHESSLNPIHVPRAWIWNLRRRTVYFGTSIPTIFKGLSTEGIQYCFWRGFVCVRGFDHKTRAPRPLMARLHFPASKLSKKKGKADGN